MSLTPLATVSDVQARMPDPTVTLTAAQTARASGLLLTASARVRGFCRQDFTQAQTTKVFSTTDNQIILPQRPVISVDTLGRVMADGITITPYAVWTFDGIATVMLGPPSAVVNAPEIWTDVDWFWRNVTYQVKYTHGYAVIPDDVVDTTATMVVRVIAGPGSPGMSSETIGGYSYRIADGFAPGVVELADGDRDVLRKYRGRRNRTVELH